MLTHDGQNIWENGLGQNTVFLAQLFAALPGVTSVVLIDVGDQRVMPQQVEALSLGFLRVNLQQAADLVDVVIEMAGAIDAQWLQLMRARGKKVVFYCCGQPYNALVEAAIFEKPATFHRADRCDEVWVLPEYADFAPLQRTLHRCPVHVVPYVWHPQFLVQRMEEVRGQTGLQYGWTPPGADRPGFRVAIFEPNISVAKTSTISMLICDEAYRHNPASVAKMSVLNTLHMATHPTLLYLANSLSLVRDHKAVFLGRHDVVGFMVENADAVVSHQWHNNQNYSYLDALYGNYPLIHNSEWLHESFGAGYYYPAFDTVQGAQQLLSALATHDANLPAYQTRSQAVFEAVNPLTPANLAAYSALLNKLCHGTAVGAAA